VASNDDPSAPDPTSRWERFLDGKTGAQRFVIALGALAGAMLAIAALVAGAARLLDQRDAGGSATGEVQRIENQQESADEFVRFLLQADQTRAAIPLNHHVIAPRGPGGEYQLQYGCGGTGRCSFVRLETPADNPDRMSDGVWYQGCWSVIRDGAGYGADHLDLELRRQGQTCP
jgi:hypothetical protein